MPIHLKQSQMNTFLSPFDQYFFHFNIFEHIWTPKMFKCVQICLSDKRYSFKCIKNLVYFPSFMTLESWEEG